MTERQNGLFPAQTWDHGFTLSLQASRGHQCSPREDLARLEDYASVEAVIYLAGETCVDPKELDLPESVLAKFAPIESSNPSVGANLTWEDVEAVRNAILRASLNPNAGIPRGRIGWSSRSVYHGTSEEFALDIEANGISVARSHGGYFGHAFYVADDQELARSNYAEFSGDEEGGLVLEYAIEDGARILDMRNPEDAKVWQTSKAATMLGNPRIAGIAVAEGIDGVYDRSVGGLAIFNAKALSEIPRIHRPEAFAPGI